MKTMINNNHSTDLNNNKLNKQIKMNKHTANNKCTLIHKGFLKNHKNLSKRNEFCKSNKAQNAQVIKLDLKLRSQRLQTTKQSITLNFLKAEVKMKPTYLYPIPKIKFRTRKIRIQIS